MSLFVAAFLIQWWAMALYGISQLVAIVPQALFQFVTTFSNVGGILNAIVYIIIRRRKHFKHSDASGSQLNSTPNSTPGKYRKANLSNESDPQTNSTIF